MEDSLWYSLVLPVTLKSFVVLAVCWLITYLSRRRSAAVRHVVWSGAFVALLALPFLSLSLPALKVPLGSSSLLTGLVFRTNSSASQQGVSRLGEGKTTTVAAVNSGGHPLDWRLSLILLWTAGTAFGLLRIGIGWTAVLRLRRRANPVVLPELPSLCESLGIRTHVDLVHIPKGSMPATTGFRRSTVFLPSDAEQWSAERRRIVLLHELAHVRRRDGAMHVVARIALSLYWWNPAAWTAFHRFQKEQEQAADDVVLSLGTSAPDYATHLLEIARSVRGASGVEGTALAMARSCQLENRLLAILDSSRPRKPVRQVSAVLVFIGAFAAAVPFAALQARAGVGQGEMLNQANPDPAAATIRNGDVQRELGQFDKAKALYEKALASSGSGPEAGTALLRLGIVDLATKDFEAATRNFEQAQSTDPKLVGEARMWMAVARQRQGDLDGAGALYEGALTAMDPKSSAAAIDLQLYSQVLRQQGREDEAKARQDEAAAIRKERSSEALAAIHASSSDVYRIGPTVGAPKLEIKLEPEYAQEAKVAKYQGSVLLSLEIGPDGVARNIRVIRSLGLGLDEKATEAVGHWRFRPGTKDGQPVTVAAQVEVNFRLL